MIDKEFEARVLAKLHGERSPMASPGAAAIAADYPYTLEQVQRAYELCQNHTTLTRAYLDLAMELGRNDPCEPNPPRLPVSSASAQDTGRAGSIPARAPRRPQQLDLLAS